MNEHPFAGAGQKDSHDLDLGDGHYLDWSTYQGETCGGIISHTRTEQQKQELLQKYPDHPEWANGLCQGAFTIRGSKWHLGERLTGASWTLSGSYKQPTLSPSFRCHCGDHGFIREGKWVKA